MSPVLRNTFSWKNKQIVRCFCMGGTLGEIGGGKPHKIFFFGVTLKGVLATSVNRNLDRVLNVLSGKNYIYVTIFSEKNLKHSHKKSGVRISNEILHDQRQKRTRKIQQLTPV